MLLRLMKIIGANTKTIFLIAVMIGIICLIGIEIIFTYSIADTGVQDLKGMISFSENIMGRINANNPNETLGFNRLNFSFYNYSQITNSTKGLNYTSGYELYKEIVRDIFGDGDVKTWK